MAESSLFATLVQDVRRLDRDRFVTAIFAPSNRRAALISLYAFNLEVARVRELVSEPLLGQIRLQWWRDTLDQIFSGTAVAHPVAEGLAIAIKAHGLSRSPFDRLLDARLADLNDTPPDDMAGLEDYAEGTSATLNALALEILGVREEAAFRAARHVGIAWALTGLLRAVPFHAASGRLYLPAASLEEFGVEVESILNGQTTPELAALARNIAQRALDHLKRARAFRLERPKTAVPALLTAPLTEIYLSNLQRCSFNLFDLNWSAPKPRPLRLAFSAWRGRY